MSEQKFTPGRVVWRELMTTDVKRARAFYSELLGWKYEAYNMGPGMNYEMVKVGDKTIGGLWQLEPGNPGPAVWMSYVSVDDVDAVAKRAVENGGKIAHGPSDIPNIGRFAVVADFAGAMILPFKSLDGDPPMGMPAPGEFCWETLSTTDMARAESFYEKVFGWKVMKNMDGIPVFSVDGTPQGMVGDLQKAENFPPNWMTYVVVDKIETMTERATKLGGSVLVPLIEIPKVGRIGLIADPMGAPLGLYQGLMG
ncbi:MAG TPA: VOC family protein [Myxococcaceae bacterium]